jgi:alpha-amylase
MVTRSTPAHGLLPILLYAWVCWAPQPAAAEPPGVLVHLFEWPWADVALECERVLGPAGIAGVQVSPPNEHRLVPGRPWWERYQPVSYQLLSRGGDRAAFAAMVDRCRAAGVGIHVDAIINHMTGPRFADDPLWGTGSAGSPYDYYRYPDYGPEDFHPCREAIGDNYQDRDRVQGCNLVSLADLDTGSERVRATLAAYLNDLTGLGVAGFRIDAAKHIAAADLSAILERVQGDPFVYQEVIEAQGEPIQGAEYFPYGLVTEFDYGRRLAEHFHNANLAGLRSLGPAWQELMPSDRALVFVDNHDKQRGHGGGGDYLTHKEPGLYTLANVFMLAWPYGTPKLMSSYPFEHGDQGPPNDQGETRPIYLEAGGDRCGDDWVCEHRWGPIRRMVGFRAATQIAQTVDHWWDNGGNQIAFGRGGLGFVVINRGERPLQQRLQTGLPPGDYCNLWEGGLADGACEGGVIRVAADGGALFTVPPMAAAMIHVQESPEPLAGDWRRTLIFIRGETQPGQDLFVRGGIDHGHARTLGRDCTPQNLACAIPIRHRNPRNPTTSGWKQGDEHLDWYGAEPGQQASASGAAAEGTPLDWTTNAWPADWGARRTVEQDGFGEEPLNTWGHHYWMLDADLDCSRTQDGWFEVKSYIAKGPGWEPDIAQPGAPWASGNHFARCGWLNVFDRGQAEPIEQRELGP